MERKITIGLEKCAGLGISLNCQYTPVLSFIMNLGIVITCEMGNKHSIL